MANKESVKDQYYAGKTVIVCGGSKGIGKETAKEIFRQGGSVSIVARGSEALQLASQEIEALRVTPEQFVETIACDTSDQGKLTPHFDKFIKNHGTPDYLINNVGYAKPDYIQNYTLDDFKDNMDVNYYGQVVPTLILLPHFIEADRGHIVFVSSVAGLAGVFGYAAYSPTKFALVGFAEVLRTELKSSNIDISVLFPPDTETPGFEIENLTKPPETVIISSVAKICTSEKVAKELIKGIKKKKFIIIFGEAVPLCILRRISPKLLFFVVDILLTNARKQISKS